MTIPRLVLIVFALLWLPLAAAPGAFAAESYDNCTGFIDTLPANITTQGTWCLRKDLSTAMTSGAAITINTNNVTIDCNDFKIGGLAAGAGTEAIGIIAESRLNVTVRRCTVRGFSTGVQVRDTGGTIIEDNRLDSNFFTGVHVSGSDSVIRRNLIVDTGGSTLTEIVAGIWVFRGVHVVDNTISGVMAAPGSGGYAIGIQMFLGSGSIVGNRIRGLVPDSGGAAYGIRLTSTARLNIRDNDVFGPGGAGSVGVGCGDTKVWIRGNVINGFAMSTSTCGNAGGNDLFN